MLNAPESHAAESRSAAASGSPLCSRSAIHMAVSFGVHHICVVGVVSVISPLFRISNTISEQGRYLDITFISWPFSIECAQARKRAGTPHRDAGQHCSADDFGERRDEDELVDLEFRVCLHRVTHRVGPGADATVDDGHDLFTRGAVVVLYVGPPPFDYVSESEAAHFGAQFAGRLSLDEFQTGAPRAARAGPCRGGAGAYRVGQPSPGQPVRSVPPHNARSRGEPGSSVRKVSSRDVLSNRFPSVDAARPSEAHGRRNRNVEPGSSDSAAAVVAPMVGHHPHHPSRVAHGRTGGTSRHGWMLEQGHVIPLDSEAATAT